MSCSPSILEHLRFQTKKEAFQFQALPFCVVAVPRKFTCTVKEVKVLAQTRNLRMHQ